MTATLERVLERALAGDGDAEHATDERILDAALTECAAYGTRRTTIDDVARRAGVARMTVFRRFGSKDALVERLMARELRRFLARVDEALAPIEDPGERVAEAFVSCVRAAFEHPLVARLARVEPGATLERMGSGSPSAFDLGRAFVASRLDPGLANREEIADLLVRAAAVYALVPGSVVDVRDEDAARGFARRVLAPLVA
jgi:AcrR family transcriptional regulator